MNWIKKGDQIINLELVSEIYKHYDKKYLIKFKLSDCNTSLFFNDEETRDKIFDQIRTKISPFDLDI